MKDRGDTYDTDHNNVDDDDIEVIDTEDYDEKISESEYQDTIETSEDVHIKDNKIRIIIVVAILIAALVAAAGIFTYQKIKANKDSQTESKKIEASQNEESQNESAAIAPTEKPMETPDITEEQPPVLTSIPKPLPSATPSPEPIPDANENVTGDAITGTGVSEDSTTQNIARVIFLGDSRFREMANYVSANDNGWECSSTGNYDWLTSTTYTNADKTVGEGTKVFINIGLNDLDRYADYAASINAKVRGDAG